MINTKEQSSQLINKIDDVLNRLDDDDEIIAIDGDFSGIDLQVDLDDLDMTGINMVAQMQKHSSSKDERVIS